ncbi:MAG: hypothetical protein ABW123_26965 [Cystobacter sp.]
MRSSEGGVGFIMEWVPGQALDVWAETGDTTFRQLARAGATVVRTLGELHARGVLHRDLKPEHLLVRESDGQPVLLDFGADWYEGAPPLTPGPLPPTIRYLLSPEAVCFLGPGCAHPSTCDPFQPTDDLYALGSAAQSLSPQRPMVPSPCPQEMNRPSGVKTALLACSSLPSACSNTMLPV